MTVTHEVAGSIPVRVAFASVAQLVERMPEEHGVAGSTPAGGTIIIPLRLTVGHRSLKSRMEVRFFQRKSWECRIAAIAPDCKSGDFGLRWLKQAAQIFDLVMIASL